MLTDQRIGVDNRDVDIVFENFIKSEVNWIKILSMFGNIEEFIIVKNNSVSVPMATMEYRRILKNRGVGQVSFLEINTAYINKEYTKLHRLLEYMFLEPITQSQFEFILNKINTKDDGMEKLHNRHLQDKGMRALSIALVL